MFKIFSDLTTVVRKSFPLEPSNSYVLVSGVTGTWVTLNASGQAIITTGKTGLAWPIWNESYRDGTLGAFTPDVVNTKTVSVVVGKIFATTDRYTGSPSLGAALTTANNGLLAAAGAGDPIVAYCVKPQYSTTYFSQTLNVIDIQIV